MFFFFPLPLSDLLRQVFFCLYYLTFKAGWLWGLLCDIFLPYEKHVHIVTTKAKTQVASKDIKLKESTTALSPLHRRTTYDPPVFSSSGFYNPK